MANGDIVTQAYAGPERRGECVQGARLEERVAGLAEYQKVQNGHMGVIRKQLWALTLLMLTTALSAIGAIIMAWGGQA